MSGKGGVQEAQYKAARQRIYSVDKDNMQYFLFVLSVSVTVNILGYFWQNIYYSMLCSTAFMVFMLLYMVLTYSTRSELMYTRLDLNIAIESNKILSAYFRNRPMMSKEEHLRAEQAKAIQDERYEDAAEIQRILDKEDGDESILDPTPA